MSSSPVLELRAVRKRFGRAQPWVLDGVDLTVNRGDVVQVAGANGSGKSTLLRVAAGLSRANRGDVARCGRATLVPDRAPTAAPMTVRAVLAHHARMQGLAGRDVRRAVERVVDEHHLQPVVDVRVGELSKGWTQRGLLAQALLSEPDLVLLDEPWSAVDRAAHDHLAVVLDQARRSGRALLMTSHEANPLPDVRWRRLAGGRLDEVDGPPRSRPGLRRVWLVDRDGTDRDPGVVPSPLPEHDGWVGSEPFEGGVVVTLTDDATGDDLLARLLDAGWTPVRIEGTGR